MALIKLGHETTVSEEGQRIVKESYDRCVVLIRAPDAPDAKGANYYCLEVPDTSYAQYDTEKLQTAPGCKKHSVYRDSDGMLWVNVTKTVKPEVDKSYRAVKYGPGAEVPDCPPPLVPFAGCDKRAMAPSPAKPLKPSPFKERVDTATEAVVRKNWNQRQAEMGALFSKQPAAAQQQQAPVPAPPAATTS